MIKALIFDIDETLVPSTTYRIEPSTLQAIEIAREKGLKIIVATGRNTSCIHSDVTSKLKPDYLVTVNGGVVFDRDMNILDMTPMKDEDVEEILRICDEKGYLYGIKCTKNLVTLNHHELYCQLYCDKAITAEMLTDKSDDPDYWKTTEKPLGIFFFSKGNEAMKLKESFPDLNFYVALPEGGECCNIKINKGEALRKLLQSIQIDLSECIAFGDSNNDVDMISMCGIGVAMGNANENTKRVADYVTTESGDNGIFNALKHFGII